MINRLTSSLKDYIYLMIGNDDLYKFHNQIILKEKFLNIIVVIKLLFKEGKI